MNDKQILDIFYNKLIPETKTGKVDCYLKFNMILNLTINNKVVSQCDESLYSGLLIPNLKINNKELFDQMLIKYVNKALDFYNPQDFYFLEDLNQETEQENFDKKNEYLIKFIICTLFANATFNDFENPIEFLYSRISMFENKILDTDNEIDLGYIESIGARLYIKEDISTIKAETPYVLKSYLEFDDGYKLSLPDIYAGNDGNRYKLYSILKKGQIDELEERPYLKQIRKGLIAKINGAPEHYFLAVMLFLSLCSDKSIEVVPFLVERWNAKRIAIYTRAQIYKNTNIEEKEHEQERVQANITDIFIRYFTKLEDVSTGIEFYGIPFDADANLHIRMNESFQSRSVAFNELLKLTNEYKNQINSFRR